MVLSVCYTSPESEREEHEPSPTEDLLRLSDTEDQRGQIFADLRERFSRIAKRRIGVQDAEDVANEASLTVVNLCGYDAPAIYCARIGHA